MEGNQVTKDTLVVVSCPLQLKEHLMEKWRHGSTHALSEPLRVRDVGESTDLTEAEALSAITVNDALFCGFGHVIPLQEASKKVPAAKLTFVHAYESPAQTDWYKFNGLGKEHHFSAPLAKSHKLYYAFIGESHGRTAAA